MTDITYRLADDHVVLINGPARVSIPKDPGNGFYAQYLAWVEEGNEPLPPVHPMLDGIEDLSEAKAIAASLVRDEAHSKLLPTDWMIVREAETAVAIPEEISSYRAAIRSWADDKLSTIAGKQKLATLLDYLNTAAFKDWPSAPGA